MTTKNFSISEAVQFGWDTMKSNISFFIGLLIVVGLIEYVPDIIAVIIKADAPFLSIIIQIASVVLSMIIAMGLIKICLRFCDGEKGEFSDLLSCYPLFLDYLIGSIIYGLIVMVGLILLIIPGIIWAIQFQFFSYLIIDRGLGPIDALKKSSEITKGVKWDLFVFGIVLGVINLLGLLCLVVGLFATIPTTIVAIAFVYRKLLAQTELTGTPEAYQENYINSDQQVLNPV